MRSRVMVWATVIGWALALAGTMLPWTYNRTSGHRWLLPLLTDHGAVVALYAGGLAALGLATVMIILRSPMATVLAPAVAGFLTLVATVLVTPRDSVFFDGYDSTGRPFGGSEATMMSSGALVCLVGAGIVLVASIVYARTPRRRA